MERTKAIHKILGYDEDLSTANVSKEILEIKSWFLWGTLCFIIIIAMNYSMLSGGKKLRPMLIQEVFALFGGKSEIVDAVNKLISKGKTAITEEDITKEIYSGAVPPPDMIVRTGGEMRLSNFLLWQSAYSELFFTDTLWPDLKNEEVDSMIETYCQRNRRYGGV